MIFGITIIKSKLLSRWIGGAGVVIGAVTIYAGLEVAYLGFGGLTTMIGISTIIYFNWVGNQCQEVFRRLDENMTFFFNLL